LQKYLIKLPIDSARKNLQYVEDPILRNEGLYMKWAKAK